ncbi:MAG: hypothetical protein GY940_21810 [bacterium]|nr:hypothetical protein [bacterium]
MNHHKSFITIVLIIGLLTWTVSCGQAAPKEEGTRETTANSFTPQHFQQHIAKLKKQVPKGFSIVTQEPFVVIGDESLQRVRQRAEHTVKREIKKLKHLYFKKNPNSIINIWLFKNKTSYMKYTWELFGDRPDTPFGYYSSRHNVLIMNIATGGGTLVHEIVHPFMESNFPECPAWFNEGLGSLYEQSSERNNKIVGLTNWRLRGLQQAIRKNTVPSFKTLMSTTEYRFYEEDPGTNYAQARYLCYYLQEKGILESFYHKFYANRKTDSTGYRTLQEVLGQTDMKNFKQEWEGFVLKLKFP